VNFKEKEVEREREKAKREEANFNHNRKELDKLLSKEKTMESTLDSEQAQHIQKSSLVERVSPS